MNEEAPFPAALPAVVPSPLGPAISYSNIRAVTSRAERSLDQLGKKVSNRLVKQVNDAGMAGAVIESKVRQRLADQLAPAEQLYQEYTDQIQNQIAGNLAPAVATLEDLGAATGESQRVTTTTETAGDGTPGAGLTPSPAAVPLTQPTPLRAGGLARQLVRASGAVAGGPPISHQAGKCASIPQQTLNDIGSTLLTDVLAAFNGNVPFNANYGFNLTDDCLLYVEQVTPPVPLNPCGTEIFEGTPDAAANQKIADIIIATFKRHGYTITYVQPDVACPPSPVDCTKTPLDPACPPDCKTHPEDPRCPPTPPTCPPPCIEVTCPPPIINVPPCQTLTPTECIQIDLCDWDKFCKFLTDCLVKSKEDCALDNDTAYTFKDCDGQFGEAQINFLAGAGGPLLQSNTIDDLATAGMALSTSISPDEFGSINPY